MSNMDDNFPRGLEEAIHEFRRQGPNHTPAPGNSSHQGPVQRFQSTGTGTESSMNHLCISRNYVMDLPEPTSLNNYSDGPFQLASRRAAHAHPSSLESISYDLELPERPSQNQYTDGPFQSTRHRETYDHHTVPEIISTSTHHGSFEPGFHVAPFSGPIMSKAPTMAIERPESFVPALHEHDDDDDMTEEEFKLKLTYWIEQMMFVSGETGDPSVETTGMIEEIVRAQVIEILTQCTETATRRGIRSIQVQDLFFLIRKDNAKTARLKDFLSWKDVRKTAKDTDEKGADADIGADDPAGGEMPGAGGPMLGDTGKKNKRAKIRLPWDVESFYSEQVPDMEDDDDEDTGESNIATLKRLKAADERTKDMTKEEYVHWSECRQASFTFRKAKRFREWAGFGVVTESKPNDDIIDILGFLTFEMVQTLTEEALKVKAEEDLHKSKTGGVDTNKKRKRETGLFDMPEDGNAPLTPSNIREAYRRLQARASKPKVWMGPKNAPRRIRLQLI